MSGKIDPTKDPSTTSYAYDFMLPRWKKMEALLGGTEAMRSAGGTYLPMHTLEAEHRWNERLASNTLFNMTEMTLDSWVGRPFSDPIVLGEDIPERVEQLLEDVDLQGNDLSVFAREWFRDGLAKAFSHVLVEFPRKRDTEAEEGRPRTLADDRQENLRPYLVHIKPENVIFAHSIVVDGQEVLVHLRIMEEVVEMDGFAEVSFRQIRVLEPGRVEIYRPVETKQKKVEWRIVDKWETGLDFIPLVTFYANRSGCMTGKSPLLDLADLNIRHWQSNSDQISILTVARFPMLSQTGGDENAVKGVGPHQLLYSDNENAKFGYVEHDGSAISAGREDLKDLEEQMASYGAEFLKRRPGNLTATARALDSAEATSPLQDATVRFTDAVNQVLAHMAAWLKITEGGGSVSITTDFGPDDAESVHIELLKEARKNRDISRETFLGEMKRLGALPDEFDAAEDAEKLAQETAAFAPPATEIDEEAPEDPEED